jgi:hypothetical protein
VFTFSALTSAATPLAPIPLNARLMFVNVVLIFSALSSADAPSSPIELKQDKSMILNVVFTFNTLASADAPLGPIRRIALEIYVFHRQIYFYRVGERDCAFCIDICTVEFNWFPSGLTQRNNRFGYIYGNLTCSFYQSCSL